MPIECAFIVFAFRVMPYMLYTYFQQIYLTCNCDIQHITINRNSLSSKILNTEKLKLNLRKNMLIKISNFYVFLSGQLLVFINIQVHWRNALQTETCGSITKTTSNNSAKSADTVNMLYDIGGPTNTSNSINKSSVVCHSTSSNFTLHSLGVQQVSNGFNGPSSGNVRVEKQEVCEVYFANVK